MAILYSDLLTVPDVARQFNCTEQCVRGWIARGLLRAHRVGRDHLIDAQDAQAFELPRRGAPKKVKSDD